MKIIAHILVLILLVPGNLWADISINPNQPLGTTYCNQPVNIAPNFTMDATFSITGMKISISQNYRTGEDELKLTGYSGTVTGYWSAAQGYMTLSGSTAISDYIQAIRMIQYRNIAVVPTPGNRTLTISLDDADYLPDTKHFYRFISDLGIYWTTAKAQSESPVMKYHGLQGYLATITSAVENAFIQQKTKGVGWIGASDQAIEGDWRWVTGPEGLEDNGQGRLFWRGTGYQAKTNPAVYGPVNNNYHNWNRWDVPYSSSLATTSWEPNNSGNEDYAHITFFPNNPSESLKWNDLPNGGTSGDYTPQGYLIEYGGMPGDPVINLVADIPLHVNTIGFGSVKNFTKCEGDPVQLNRQDTVASYRWSPVAGLSNPKVSDPLAKPKVSTVYTVVGTNGSCQDSARFQININPAPLSALQKVNNICTGSKITLDPGLHTSYQWNTGALIRTLAVGTTGLYVVKITDNIGCTTTDTAAVVVQAFPKIDLSKLNNLVCGTTSATLAISKDKGDWLITNLMNNQKFTSPAIQVAAYGAYPFGFHLSDSFGCVSDTFVTIGFHELPKLNLGNDTTICKPQSINLDGGANLASYQWSTNETTRTIKVQTPGSYWVIVKNQAGCPNQDFIQVNFDDLPKLDLSKLDTLKCGIKSAALILSSDKGNYQLKSTDPSVLINGLTVTVPNYGAFPFVFKVTDQYACAAQSSFKVGFYQIPALDLGNDTTICKPQSLLLDAGPGMASYTWTTKDTVRSIKVQTAANYGVLIKSKEGCTNLDNIQVNFVAVPKLDLSKLDTLFCGVKAAIVKIAADKGKYVLKSPDPFVTVNGLNVSTLNFGTFPFNFKATDQYSCASDTSFSMGFHEVPVVNLGNDTTICNPSTILLDAGAGLNKYHWSTGETLRSIEVKKFGKYNVVVTNNYGCPTRDSIRINFTDKPKLNLSKLDTLVCGTKSAVLDITVDKGKYQLSSSDAVVNINGLSATVPIFGVYPFSFVSKDQYGCTTDTSFTMGFHKIPKVNFSIDESNCYGYNLQATYIGDAVLANSRFFWVFGGDTISAKVGQNIENIPLGVDQPKRDLQLTVNEEGCRDSSKIKDIKVIPTLKMSVVKPLQCQPLSFEFNGFNTETGVQYIWNLGDGTISNTRDILHQYKKEGYYDVSLTVITDKGCTNTATMKKMVYVAPIPTVGFSILPGKCLNTGKDTLTYVGSAGSKDTFFWNLQGFDAAEIVQSPDTTSGPFVFDLIKKPKTSLTLHVVSSYGCKSDTASLVVMRKPIFSNSTTVPIGCPPLQVDFKAHADDPVDNLTFHWDYGDGNTAAGGDVTHTYLVPNLNHDLGLNVVSSVTGCSDSIFKAAYIVVHPLPKAGFSVDRDVVTNDNPVVNLLDLSTDGVNYYWDFGDGSHSREKNPVHNFELVGRKRIIQTVYNQFDCQDTISTSVLVAFNRLFAPNAISPGAPNAVDRVFLLKSEGIKQEGYHLTIMSRWSDVVFESKDEIKGWDGKMNNGQFAPPGNYVWILECIDFIGRPHRQTGTLTLVF